MHVGEGARGPLPDDRQWPHLVAVSEVLDEFALAALG